MSPFIESLQRKYIAIPQKITKEKLDEYLIDRYISEEEYNYITTT